jgi:anti-sigma28 factor (negative regulator of flagellin synthesis)
MASPSSTTSSNAATAPVSPSAAATTTTKQSKLQAYVALWDLEAQATDAWLHSISGFFQPKSIKGIKQEQQKGTYQISQCTELLEGMGC